MDATADRPAAGTDDGPSAPTAPREKIKVTGLYKIFGERPQEALDLIDRGFSKDVVFEKTKQTVGVNGADLTIREGEIFVVMGLSGSGKSTLVRLLNRLIEPTRGSVEVDGVDIAKIDDKALIDLRRRDMSMVFQSFALLPHLKVIDNAAFGLELAGVPVEERKTKALAALEQVGLAPYADSYPNQLSGGMQQRVGLARALASDPSILLMDEAFSALDPLIRSEMQDELLRLQAEQQRTVVFISHDLDEAMRIGDRIAIMEGGSIVQIGTPDEILRNPADAYVRNFFSGVDISKVLTAGDIANNQHVTVLEREGHGIPSAIDRLKRYDREVGYVVDRKKRFCGLVTAESLHRAGKTTDDIARAFVADVETVPAANTLTETVPIVARATTPVPVVDETGRYRGAISKTALLEALDRTEEDAPEAAA